MKSTTRATDVDRVAAELRAALGPLFRRLRHSADDELTFSQVSVLVRLERDGPCTPGALAAAESMRAQSMGAIVESLVALGLVTRSADEHDRRRVVVSLSALGRASLTGVRQNKARRLSAAINSELTADEVRELHRAIPLLERIGRVV